MGYRFILPLILASMGELHAGDNAETLALPADRWALVTDGVMGGVSRAEMSIEKRHGESCVALRGQVSTANNGGFIQITLDIRGSAALAAGYDGLKLDVIGNGEVYNIHLRTSDLWLPWQSFRASFETTSEWRSVYLPFSGFEPYRTNAKLRLPKLRRLGVVAIGRDFDAELCVKAPAFYRLRD
jgi:hypothetical protein